jgi:hypothetical protein
LDPIAQSSIVSGASVEMITSVALITATAGFPFFSFNLLADEELISDTI